MEAYTSFAMVYDIFMDNIPYKEWSQYIVTLLKEYGVNSGLILELGCGTGNLTENLALSGYNMIGIDCSEEMLEIAREKSDHLPDYCEKILYLLQDMREFELYGTVSAVVSICDSMNYIRTEEDLVKVFKLVNNYLDKDGVFIFDLNTEYKYKHILADNIIAENREHCSFIWENFYDSETKQNEYDLTLYVKENCSDSNCYVRFDETHYEQAYSLETIQVLLERAGMEFVIAYDAFTKNPVTKTSERIYIIAKEGQQERKYYSLVEK